MKNKSYMPIRTADSYVIIEKSIHSFNREEFEKDFHREEFGFCTVYHLRYIMFTETDCKKCKIIEYKSASIPKVELVCDSFDGENIFNIKTLLSQYMFFAQVEFIFKNEYDEVVSKLPRGYEQIIQDDEIVLIKKMCKD